MPEMTRKRTAPGNIFLEDVMKPLHLSVAETAKMMGISEKELTDFVNDKTPLSPDMALRISRFTNTSAESWMNIELKRHC